jgi:hypothetical protein
VNVLCDWLDDPTLYEWVKFEADEDAEVTPPALDDVVATPIHICWRLRVDSRSSDYDNWASSELYGKLGP